jgi:hypothetical protein
MNYIILNDSMVLNYGGKTISIANTDERYTKVIDLIRDNKLEEIPAVIEAQALAFSGEGVELRDGVIVVDGVAIPHELSDRVLKFREQKLPFEPLLNFWRNLRKNPSFNSRQMLYKFLEHNGHPITPDGCFIAYRGIRDDLKDMHTGTFNNAPGQVCEIARDQVDDNPNNTCSHGLHVACFDYAKGFGQKLVEVKVNPSDVVAVPTDYNGTKMRVCKFEVLNLIDKPRAEELASDVEGSDYMTEDEVDEQEANDWDSEDDYHSCDCEFCTE